MIPIPEGSGFGLDNLPLGRALRPDVSRARLVVAVGDHALDLRSAAEAGLLPRRAFWGEAARRGRLDQILRTAPIVWAEVRAGIAELVTDPAAYPRLVDAGAVVERSALTMLLPVPVPDYVDGYGSLHHATRLGRRFRPDGDPLLPNWRHLPVAYHGRSSTIVPTGRDIPRPSGLRPTFGPTEQLDFELEVGCVIGVGSRRGTPIPIDDVDDHLYGFCLVNDWSARDIQAFEHQPLGPFLGKSFATSMSPWLVGNEALRPYRVTPPVQDPAPAPYLRATEPWGLDLHLEVEVNGEVVSRVDFADHYWTPAQQLAHLTSNGASTRSGDLIASGTVSGPAPGSEGSLIEKPEARFLDDWDRVTLRGWAGDRDGGPWIDLGEVTGQVTP